jgi:hypothetical protein
MKALKSQVRIRLSSLPEGGQRCDKEAGHTHSLKYLVGSYRRIKLDFTGREDNVRIQQASSSGLSG